MSVAATARVDGAMVAAITQKCNGTTVTLSCSSVVGWRDGNKCAGRALQANTVFFDGETCAAGRPCSRKYRQGDSVFAPLLCSIFLPVDRSADRSV